MCGVKWFGAEMSSAFGENESQDGLWMMEVKKMGSSIHRLLPSPHILVNPFPSVRYLTW